MTDREIKLRTSTNGFITLRFLTLEEIWPAAPSSCCHEFTIMVNTNTLNCELN